ncbi:MAG TPA: response regulator [Desulfomonilaceae bacterium]|nr:response regulator [Desulfomonilaceae bacterium]
MIKPRLLLVDDEIPFTANLSKLLSRRGYDVSVVNDGKSALRIIEEQKFDVVILDQKMPGMDGITTLREIKKKRPHMEVIILTGYGSGDSALDGLQLGAYDYTMKPIQLSDLEEKIGQAFQRKLLQEKE